MSKAAVTGCAGRMGQGILKALTQSKILKLTAAIERPGHPQLGLDALAFAGLSASGVKISDALGAAKGCSVIIDFTSPAATEATLNFAREQGINLVVGTTGLSDAQKKLVEDAAKKIAVVFSPNMGVGVNVLLNLVQNLSRILGEPYDIEVVESHHRHKKDSPSGTAQALAEAAAKGRGIDLHAGAVHGRYGDVGPRKPGEIGIHSLRGGDTIGEHTVVFAGPGEKIEISHTAVARDVFAQGAVRAAEFLHRRAPGLYTMQDVLGLSG